MRKLSIAIFIAIITLSSCKEQVLHVEEQFVYEELKTENHEANEIIYSMYLPTDMTSVFSHTGNNYDATIPASIENLPIYNTEEQMAVMLGILGVDLMYMKLLDQSIPAAQYYKAIESLSGKLEIPSIVFKKSSEKLEAYFSNNDSLGLIIESIYKDTDKYFKATGKQNLAALSLVGGWVEAMYIGTQIYENDSTGNHLMVERLLQQKYSLNSIYTILSNHQESLSVKGYLLMLRKLKKSYEAVSIRHQKEGFTVDTDNKKLTTYKTHYVYEEETLNQVLLTIPLIRKELLKTEN